MVGRGGPSEEERNLVERHPLIVYEGDQEQTYVRKEPPTNGPRSDVAVRVRILSYLDEKDMPALYSSREYIYTYIYIYMLYI